MADGKDEGLSPTATIPPSPMSPSMSGTLNGTFSFTRGPPANQVEWKTSSDGVLKDALSATQEMFKHLDEHKKTYGSNPPPQSKQLDRSLPSRRLAALKRAQSCVEFPGNALTNVGPRATITLHRSQHDCKQVETTVEKALANTGDCLLRAQHAMKTKFAYLKVCERRIELRSRRPPQEQFSDHLQVALETERETLLKARMELQENVKQLEQMYKDLENIRKKVAKTYAEISRQTPPSPGAETVDSLLKRAEKLRDAAYPIIKKGNESISHHEKECLRVNQKTSESLAKRAAETYDRKTKLEEQMAEIDKAMQAAEATVFSSKTRFGEADMGPIKDKVDATEELLVKLRAARINLEEELRCKIAAFKVDDQCRRIVPHSTPTHKETHTFKPGKMGISYDDNGLVKDVVDNGPAHIKGIQKGNRIVKVGDAQYSKADLAAAEESGAHYKVTFEVTKDPKTRDFGKIMLSMSSPNLSLSMSLSGLLDSRPDSPAGGSSPLKAAAATTMMS